MICEDSIVYSCNMFFMVYDVTVISCFLDARNAPYKKLNQNEE